MFFTAKIPRTFTHVIRQHDCSQWEGPRYPQFGRLATRMQSFSTWPASSNQSVDDLSKVDSFYTGIVFYRTPLWSSGQSFWLQIQRSRFRSPALPDFLSSSGSGTGSTQPREPREFN